MQANIVALVNLHHGALQYYVSGEIVHERILQAVS
jgi:hypothetical protein